MNIEFFALAAIGTIGVMEWVKGFSKLKELPGWVWRIVLLPVSLGLGFLSAAPWQDQLLRGTVLLAITQIGYPVLVQLPTLLVDAIKQFVVAKLPQKNPGSNPPGQ